MNPFTHLLVSWPIAQRGVGTKKDRLLITISGIIPDIDGLGILGGIIHDNKTIGLELWSTYHHVLSHNLPFCLLIASLFAVMGKAKLRVFALTTLCFHIHLFCDLIGSRGPDNYQWPIPYLWPLYEHPQLVWQGQWQLNTWPNILITVVFLGFTLYMIWKRGESPIGLLFSGMDKKITIALRGRFGNP